MRPLKYIITNCFIIGVILFWFSFSSEAQIPQNPDYAPRNGFYLEHIVLFTDDASKSRLRLFASIIYDDLTFLRTDGKFAAEYRATFSVVDKKGNYIDSKRLTQQIVTADFYETNSREKFDILMVDFDLSPGDYKVIFEFTDRESRENHQQEKDITVPALGDAELLISGPILLDSVSVNENNNLELRPGVSGDVFDGGQNIWVYFEVLSRVYPAELNVNYRFIDEKGEERISGSYSRQIEGPTLRDKFLLEIKKFNFGNYQLILKVSRDGASAQKSRKVRIHWPGLPPIINDLDRAIEQLVYIASQREITRMKEYYKARKLEMFVKFWAKWANGDQIEGYKLMEEYYRRMLEADRLFDEGGWKCDRGHVYVIHGPPSEVDRHPYDLYSKAYEIWYYLEDNKRFIFVDEGGFGDYRLQSPFWGG